MLAGLKGVLCSTRTIVSSPSPVNTQLACRPFQDSAVRQACRVLLVFLEDPVLVAHPVVQVGAAGPSTMLRTTLGPEVDFQTTAE
jgi:hypothetical protein